MVSGGMVCVKYTLFCFNLLFAISGLAILTIGAVIQAAFYRYSDFVDPSYVTPPIILIVVGATVFVVAFFGCCGAVRESHCMLITFSVLLLIIFSLELAAGIAGYIRRDDAENMLKDRFNWTMDKYNQDIEIKNSWNVLQHDLTCCGMNGPDDWKKVFKNDSLPYTCCKDAVNGVDSCTLTSTSLVNVGCMPALKEIVETNVIVLGTVGMVIAIIQLVGVVFACCLARSIRREYETV